MIDYYLHKKCPLTKNKFEPRCNGCIWSDKKTNPHKCIWSLDYSRSIKIDEIRKRILLVNELQQSKLSEPFRRIII